MANSNVILNFLFHLRLSQKILQFYIFCINKKYLTYQTSKNISKSTTTYILCFITCASVGGGQVRKVPVQLRCLVSSCEYVGVAGQQQQYQQLFLPRSGPRYPVVTRWAMWPLQSCVCIPQHKIQISFAILCIDKKIFNLNEQKYFKINHNFYRLCFIQMFQGASSAPVPGCGHAQCGQC